LNPEPVLSTTTVEHLYLHIPFCHRICPYCSFYKHQHGDTNLGAFVEAVLAEARRRVSQTSQPVSGVLPPPAVKLRTVYLGGGTPTALSEPHLQRLLAGLREVYDFSGVVEFCSEANPRTVTEGKAAMMRAEGITRMSLGVQAWDEPTLRTLGRDHAPCEAEETFHTLRAAGFPSVSLDLMFSIPGQALEQWRHTLEKTLSLRPDHISAYNLNYEEDTEFFERLGRGEFREDVGRDSDFFFTALDTLNAAGYEHYETSNYARPGHRSAHNESYWRGADYLGLGPSAFSTVGGVRWQNVCDTRAYIEKMQQGAEVVAQSETITPDKRRIERFGLELRTAAGLPVDLITGQGRRMMESLLEEGLITLEAGAVRLSRQGKPLVDEIAVGLMAE
jgi:oxygen-independent coproporphyrinogen-3 oxidase